MSGAFLSIDRVTKRFASVTAVDRAELAIARGEFFSLLGPSGCGKTTLLRMIAGFEMPDEGDIFIEDQNVTDEPPNRRPTNMVFQSYAIFPHLNVFDNIAYGLRREGLSKTELQARVGDALALIKLDGFAGRRADQLSGGQRQRVALARALVMRPKVLLLDEPLGALDRRLREAMQVELRQLQKNVGITFVFVTHDQEEALSMSDRIAVMSAGRVLQVAAPRMLYEAPNCREVADFIGTMNFLEGRVCAVEPQSIVVDTAGAGRMTVAHPPDFARAMDAKILVALRPEKIMLSSAPSGQLPVNRLSGTIAAATYLGERSHFYVAVDGLGEPIAVARQNARNDEVHPPGATVLLSWEPDAAVVLPR